jgi:4-hydroxy-3-methylbut-2-enyl diphosphate reductase
MKIRIAKNSGFCFGVKRAIKLAMDESKKYPKLSTLGPIIHNPQMVAKLESQGVKSIESLEEFSGDPIIIRSHGITSTTYNKLNEMKIKIIDATCPYVKNAQESGSKLSKKGYTVFIVGSSDHPEVKAISSYIEGESYIVQRPEEIPDKLFPKIGVVCQTTQQFSKLEKIIQKLIYQSKEIRIINTICNATTLRQESTRNLAKECDIMVVIGGKNSSNTKMLAVISSEIIPTYHIETENEIKKEWFKNVENIGLTAGASTPDWIITNVYNKIINLLGFPSGNVNNVEDIPGY